MTSGIGLAGFEQFLERRLASSGERQREAIVRRRQAAQNRRANRFRVRSYVDKSDPSTVRAAIEIDSRVAQSATHLLEIGNRLRSRIGGEVRPFFQLDAALANLLRARRRAQVLPQVAIGIEAASERV